MDVLSLVVALVAVVVAVLALRRVDVVDRRLGKRATSAGGQTERSDSESRTTGSEAQITDPELPSSEPHDKTAGADQIADRNAAEDHSGHVDAELVRRVSALESRSFDGISQVAVVRYDAFEGSGGQLSYSVALLDEQGHGIVLTAIHGQAETRTYVKEIPLSEDTGRPAELSPEEREVLRKATGSRSGGKSDRKKSDRKSEQ